MQTKKKREYQLVLIVNFQFEYLFIHKIVTWVQFVCLKECLEEIKNRNVLKLIYANYLTEICLSQ